MLPVYCKDGFWRPRPYLSYSQYNLFIKDPREYARVYIHGEEQTNAAMQLGKYVDDMINNDTKQEDPILEHLRIFRPVYQFRQYKLKGEINGVPIYGIFDGFDEVPIRLGEIKTGRCWTQEMADETEQLTFYALLIYLKFKIRPEELPITLTWMPTDWNGGDPIMTGEIFNFETHRNTRQILILGSMLMRVWKEIGYTCSEEYKSIGYNPFINMAPSTGED